MSKLETNTIDTVSGTNTLTLGSSNLSTINMASGVSPGTGMGKILQVVSTTKTDTFSTTAGGDAPATITGLTATITPSSTSSKILVIPNANIGSSSDNHIALTLFRGTTAIGIGDTASNRPRASFTGSNHTVGGSYTWNMQTASFNFLDTPSSTSSLSYSVKVGGNGSTTIYVNRSGRDRDITTEDGRYASTITLMEISA